ncbi:unnamed protein product [Didymodactylos carnosus]|uniref:Uncharacterized protein n=1 Tax=Didymodactylos carnosus TaxID=1234261 RepID=A0A813QBJ7_9BILA|nr:unnamed protein product [Didymodactylos carnosus]CAF3546597.1 unnamed protein product [Didymodactylos carnosus]
MTRLVILLVLFTICGLTQCMLFKKDPTKTDTSKAKPAKKEKPVKCPIVKAKCSSCVGDTIWINKDFAPQLKKVDTIAKQCGIKLAVKGSYTPSTSAAGPFNTAHAGRHINFIVNDKTGKKLLCNRLCLAQEGEKVPEVKCLVAGLRKENIRYAPKGAVGSFDDASDAKPNFSNDAKVIQEACKGLKF